MSVSDSIPVETRQVVKHRDHAQCVVCGYDRVQVCHILARNKMRDFKVIAMKNISPYLSDFDKSDNLNLISLCPNHHLEYQNGFFVLLPGPTVRAKMKAHEEQDFADRQETASTRGFIPPRTLPFLLADTIEYVPINFARPERACVHTSTEWDPEEYAFKVGYHPEPVIPYTFASAYALLWESERFLRSRDAYNADARTAIKEANDLLDLYRRVPRLPNDTRVSVPVIEGLASSSLQARRSGPLTCGRLH